MPRVMDSKRLKKWWSSIDHETVMAVQDAEWKYSIKAEFSVGDVVIANVNDRPKCVVEKCLRAACLVRTVEGNEMLIDKCRLTKVG